MYQPASFVPSSAPGLRLALMRLNEEHDGGSREVEPQTDQVLFDRLHLRALAVPGEAVSDGRKARRERCPEAVEVGLELCRDEPVREQRVEQLHDRVALL